MPLVRIEIIKGKDIDYKKKIMDSVHTALISAIQIGDWQVNKDNFQYEEMSKKWGTK